MSLIKKMTNEKVNRLSMEAGKLYLQNPNNPKIEKLHKEIEKLIEAESASRKIQIQHLEEKIDELSLKAGRLYLENPNNPKIEILYKKIEKLILERNSLVDEMKAKTVSA